MQNREREIFVYFDGDALIFIGTLQFAGFWFGTRCGSLFSHKFQSSKRVFANCEKKYRKMGTNCR